MIAPLSRSILRYLAGYLVLRAIIPQDMADMIANDPDLAILIGGAIATMVEGVWIIARKRKWER